MNNVRISRKIRNVAIGVAAGAVIALVPSVSSAAADGGPAANFAAQAHNAGLTSSQAATLQARVDSYLAKAGGVQVAANEVSVPGGDVLFALPGEKRARHIDGASNGSVTPMVSCAYHYICGTSGQDYTGDVVTASHCGTDVEVPDSFTGYGSWINNQTPGVKAYFKNKSHSKIYTTAAAYSYNSSYNWKPVWYIDAC